MGKGKNGGDAPGIRTFSEALQRPTGDGLAGPAAPPTEITRGVVTILLALYLVGLLLCVAGNSASGSSALVRTIKTRLFSPWMVPLWLAP